MAVPNYQTINNNLYYIYLAIDIKQDLLYNYLNLKI
jgi:hypothetical protein